MTPNKRRALTRTCTQPCHSLILILSSVKVRQAVQQFLHPGSKQKKIPTQLRGWIRQISELCPESAYTSRELALHCLTTNCGNTLCLYHHYHDKLSIINDSNPPRAHKVTGVPWKRNAYGKAPGTVKIKLEDPNALHCGCQVDEVLWDFYWWKTEKIFSPTLNIAEPWRNTRVDPRTRGFFVQFLERFALVDINDIYTGSTDFNRSWMKRLEHMEGNIRHARKVLRRDMERLALGGH